MNKQTLHNTVVFITMIVAISSVFAMGIEAAGEMFEFVKRAEPWPISESTSFDRALGAFEHGVAGGMPTSGWR